MYSIAPRDSPLAARLLLSPDEELLGGSAAATYILTIERGRTVSPVLLHALRAHARARTRVAMVCVYACIYMYMYACASRNAYISSHARHARVSR